MKVNKKMSKENTNSSITEQLELCKKFFKDFEKDTEEKNKLENAITTEEFLDPFVKHSENFNQTFIPLMGSLQKLYKDRNLYWDLNILLNILVFIIYLFFKDDFIEKISPSLYNLFLFFLFPLSFLVLLNNKRKNIKNVIFNNILLLRLFIVFNKTLFTQLYTKDDKIKEKLFSFLEDEKNDHCFLKELFLINGKCFIEFNSYPPVIEHFIIYDYIDFANKALSLYNSYMDFSQETIKRIENLPKIDPELYDKIKVKLAAYAEKV